jgi:hypothetical protein
MESRLEGDINSRRDDPLLASGSQLMDKIKNHHPGHLAVVLVPYGEIQLTKTKYIVQNHLKLGPFIHWLRGTKKINNIKAIQSIHVFVEVGGVDNKARHIIPSINETIASLTEKFAGDDGILHLRIGLEDTFGYIPSGTIAGLVLKRFRNQMEDCWREFVVTPDYDPPQLIPT